MPGRTGTYDIASLIATLNPTTNAVEFGLEDLRDVLSTDLENWNRVMREALAEVAVFTVERQGITGVSTTGRMQKGDEYSRPLTQKPEVPSQVGYPLDMFQHAVGWTRKWFERKTAVEVLQQSQNAQKAHRMAVLNELKRAILLATNYTFQDYLIDKVSFGVKRLANADSAAIPNGPNGEVFDGATHTHYLFAASLTAAAADALVATVVEHGYGNMRIYSNKASETGWRALPLFVAAQPANIVLATNANQSVTRLDVTRQDDRLIGYYNGVAVYSKPWIPANYHFGFDAENPAKPVKVRERAPGSFDLRMIAEIDAYPFHVEYLESEFGIGVWTRVNGAALFSNGGSYTDPVIPA